MASNIALKGWNIVAGKPPRRGPSFNPYKARTRPQQNQQNPKAKAPVKRARVSTASTTSTISTDEIRSPSRSIMTLTLETFKSLNVDEKLDNIFLYLQNIREVSERLDVTESHVRELRDRVDDNIEMTTLLSYKSIDAEARQRRNNLIFWGIPESVGEDCIGTIKEFLSDKFSLDPDSICIQRAHRLGRAGRSFKRTIQHRPLIIGLRDYQDCELILSNASKLRNSVFGISRDFPQEIVNARKILRREMKPLKERFPSSSISIQYPAKLIIDGRIHMDMFPKWGEIMKRNRLNFVTDGGSSSRDGPNGMGGGEVFNENTIVHPPCGQPAVEKTSPVPSHSSAPPGARPDHSVHHETITTKQVGAPSLFSSIRRSESPPKSSPRGNPTNQNPARTK